MLYLQKLGELLQRGPAPETTPTALPDKDWAVFLGSSPRRQRDPFVPFPNNPYNFLKASQTIMYDMDSDSSACFGGNKRPAAPTGPESTKKRAPYASRACDACRRRKGRCSGESPCTYCVSRSLECGGMGEQQATGFQANLTPPPSVTSRDSRTTTAPLPPNRGQFQSFSGEETQYGANADIR